MRIAMIGAGAMGAMFGARFARTGAEVVLYGESVAECAVRAREIAAAEGLAFVHPYDDPLIVAGQGTCAKEMLADVPQLDTLIVPIGGGGLCAGMALWAKHVNPKLRVFGVQTEMCPSMRAALRGEPMPPLKTHTLADGIAVKTPGAIPLEILKSRLDDVLLVDETDVETAVQMLVAQQKVVTRVEFQHNASFRIGRLARDHTFNNLRIFRIVAIQSGHVLANQRVSRPIRIHHRRHAIKRKRLAAFKFENRIALGVKADGRHRTADRWSAFFVRLAVDVASDQTSRRCEALLFGQRIQR